MQLLHCYRPHLLLDLARQRRASGSWPTGPIVLGGQPWGAGTVLDADPAARHLGVRRGMPLGSAHRLAPEATFLDPEPEADRASIEAAFEALATFSPAIAGSADPADQAFGLLEAQIDGLELLWGPEPVLVERIGAKLAPILAGPPRNGIAGTRFAAMVAAATAEPGALMSVPPGGEAAFLAPMPTGLLTQDAETIDRFVAAMQRLEQVMECYIVLGECDAMLRVVVADLDDYRRFQTTHLTRANGISNVKTDLPSQVVKRSYELPL